MRERQGPLSTTEVVVEEVRAAITRIMTVAGVMLGANHQHLERPDRLVSRSPVKRK